MENVLHILLYIYYFIQGFIALYFLQPVLLFFLDLGSRNKDILSKYPVITDKNFNFAAIITAHQDLRFIPPLIDSLLRQKYPNFKVYVVADDADISNLKFDDPRILILKPEQPFHAKVKSIKYAIDNFIEKHDALVIFDSDNLVHWNYFNELNKFFQRGFKAVQTHMLSKNINSVYARLDSIGHIYNNFVERKTKMRMGLSSSILGLGIAIDVDLYKRVIYDNILGGFDKKLQAEVIKNISQLAFAEEAIVYDEKVEDGKTFERQRTRWIFTYFKYINVSWDMFITGWRRMNFNLIYFGFVLLRPPLFITMILACVFMLTDIKINPALSIGWGFLIVLFSITFFMIIATQSRQKGMLKTMVYIPLILIRQVKAFFKMKQANQNFLQTEHNKVMYIEDVARDETI